MGNSNFDILQANYVIGAQTVLSQYGLFLSPGAKHFFVCNATTGIPEGGVPGSAGGGDSPLTPCNSIDTTVGKCTASRGDVIHVLPGHVETVIAAGGLDLDVVGITLIGYGVGSNRPTINFTTATTADTDIDAANITMINFLFTGGIDALAGPLDVNSADFKLLACEYRDVTGQCTDFCVADANADRMLVDGFVYRGDSAAGTNSVFALIGNDNVVIRNFDIDGNFAVGGIDLRTTACVNVQTYNGRFRTRNAADIFIIDTITGSTGAIGPGLYLRLQDNAANITEAITGATFVVYDDVFVVNLANEKAMLINWTASTDA